MEPTTIHPFEKAGLGRAPFRLVFVEERRGPIRYVDPKTGIEMTCGSPGQPMGSCAYCATGIATCCGILSADGKRFIVGSDCVRKTGQASLIENTEREVRKLKKATTAARIGRTRELLQDGNAEGAVARDALAAMPHPNARLAELGKSELDYARWILGHAGAAGGTKIARKVEKLLAGAAERDARDERYEAEVDGIAAARDDERAHGRD